MIPTVLVGGPLAMLAMLFPAVFGGWKRWLVLLSTTATNSSLFMLQTWFFNSLAGSWWGSPLTLWTAMTVVSVLGIAWAWSRHLARVQEGEAPALPGRAELIVLLAIAVLTTVGLGFARYILKLQLEWREWWPAITFLGALWVGILYVLYVRLLRGPRLRSALATEAIILTALVLLYTLVAPSLQPQGLAGGLEGGDSGVAVTPVWTFRLPAKGAIASSPLVSGDRVYVAAAHDGAFRPYGAVYCLDRTTGEPLWTFDDNGKMKQVFSSPVVVDGRLYIGEGLHQDAECRIFCLSADKGEKLWEFLTESHTESTPAVVGGKLYCGAGDDGMYCLSAGKGEKLWQFPSFHIDASPVVVGDRVYAGCGIGDVYKTTALFCLDAKTGQPRWRVNTELPVWGRAVVAGNFVYAGTGNGRLNESDSHPAGAVLCVRAADGDEVWKRKLPDGVLGRLAADRRNLFFGCRDGYFYCLRRSDGAQVWRRKMGTAVVAGPALEAHLSGEAAAERLYAVGNEGYLACMEPATGKLLSGSRLALARPRTKTDVEVIATPALEVRTEKDGSEVRRLYVGLTLKSSGGRLGELHCYEETTVIKECANATASRRNTGGGNASAAARDAGSPRPALAGGAGEPARFPPGLARLNRSEEASNYTPFGRNQPPRCSRQTGASARRISFSRVPFLDETLTVPAIVVDVLAGVHQSDTDRSHSAADAVHDDRDTGSECLHTWESCCPGPRPRFELLPAHLADLAAHRRGDRWGRCATDPGLLDGGPAVFHTFAPEWGPLFWNLAGSHAPAVARRRRFPPGDGYPLRRPRGTGGIRPAACSQRRWATTTRLSTAAKKCGGMICLNFALRHMLCGDGEATKQQRRWWRSRWRIIQGEKNEVAYHG